MYIGSCLNTMARLNKHDNDITRTWITAVRTIKIEQHETQAEALNAECQAIIKENPLHNVKSHPDQKRQKRRRRLVLRPVGKLRREQMKLKEALSNKNRGQRPPEYL